MKVIVFHRQSETRALVLRLFHWENTSVQILISGKSTDEKLSNTNVTMK